MGRNMGIDFVYDAPDSEFAAFWRAIIGLEPASCIPYPWHGLLELEKISACDTSNFLSLGSRKG